MPLIDTTKEKVHIESYNLGRFAIECSKAGHETLTIKSKPLRVWSALPLFTVVSGVPFAAAADIARRLPSRRDESHSDKPDPDVDVDGKGPKEGGEAK